MARDVIWSPQALADAEAIWARVATDSRTDANRILEEFEAAADLMADFPGIGRMIPEFREPDRRETFVYRWRVMFRVTDAHVRILRIVHGARLLENVPGSFKEPEQAEYAPK